VNRSATLDAGMNDGDCSENIAHSHLAVLSASFEGETGPLSEPLRRALAFSRLVAHMPRQPNPIFGRFCQPPSVHLFLAAILALSACATPKQQCAAGAFARRGAGRVMVLSPP
jgi:hypothetical protein